MRDTSQNFPITFIHSHKIIILLFVIIAGCTHLGFVENSALSPNINVERSYFPNGNIEYEAEFINGKLDGLSRVWIEDGTLISESEYNNGQPHGMWKRYHNNGLAMYTMQYEYGQKHGYEIWYYKNAHVKSEQKFNNGTPISEIIRWKPDGTLLY